MISQPLVTVNILSYNRKDELRNTLTKVYEQDYKNIEVIVVDNASIDGSPEMVEKEFPDVILIRLDKNIGIAGWNKGFEIAKGEYVLVLDDDSYPQYSTLNRGIDILLFEPEVGIVALSVMNKHFKICETHYFERYPISFIGCGAIIRRSVLLKIGFYETEIFIYHNELDLSIRMLNAGYKIKYLPNATVIHNYSIKSRFSNTNDLLKTKFRFYNFYWSYFVFLRKNFSETLFWSMYLKLFFNRLLVAIFFNYWKEFLKVTSTIIRNYSKIKSQNRNINNRVQIRYTNIIRMIDRDFFKKQINYLKK